MNHAFAAVNLGIPVSSLTSGLVAWHWCRGSTRTAATYTQRRHKLAGARASDGLKMPISLACAGGPRLSGPLIAPRSRSIKVGGPSCRANTCVGMFTDTSVSLYGSLSSASLWATGPERAGALRNRSHALTLGSAPRREAERLALANKSGAPNMCDGEYVRACPT